MYGISSKLNSPFSTIGKATADKITAPTGSPEGGAVASWLVRSTLERTVRVRALAGDIVLCSWARHFTLTVPLSTQANLMLGGNPASN